MIVSCGTTGWWVAPTGTAVKTAYVDDAIGREAFHSKVRESNFKFRSDKRGIEG